jgi:hypothetical protein
MVNGKYWLSSRHIHQHDQDVYLCPLLVPAGLLYRDFMGCLPCRVHGPPGRLGGGD